MSRLLPALVFLLCPCLPAFAQEAPAQDQAEAAAPGESRAPPMPVRDNTPGPVEQFVLAHRLFAAGAAASDGLTQVAAARLLAGYTLRPSALVPESEGPNPESEPTPPPDATQLLGQAVLAVEADETLGILLSTTIANAEFLPKASLNQSAGSLGPGQTHRYRIAADGGVALDLGLISPAAHAPDLSVATESGLLCEGVTFCQALLADSGFVTVTLHNPGDAPAAYWLLNN